MTLFCTSNYTKCLQMTKYFCWEKIDFLRSNDL